MVQRKTRAKGFQEKDLVLAKMHGFPAWPSFVMPDSMIPDQVLKVKKKTTNFCVIFIPDGDYYWMNEKSLELLTEEKLNKKLGKVPKGRPKPKVGGKTLHVNDALLASKNLTFDSFMDRLNRNGPLDGEAEGEEAPEDENIDEEADAVDEDDEEQGNEADSSDTKPQLENHSRATGSRLRRSGDQDDSNSSAGQEHDSTSSKRKAASENGARKVPKKETKASKATPSNGNGSEQKDQKESSPKERSPEERQHQLWLCRIKLQRSLIQRNQPVTPSDPKQYPPPTTEELQIAALILQRLVDFPISVELLRSTKIHKVLKCILRDEDLAYMDSFKIHDKCKDLLDRWASHIDVLKAEKHSGSRASVEGSPSSQHTGLAETSSAKLSSNGAAHSDGSVAPGANISVLAHEDSEISALENFPSDQAKKDP